MQDWTRYQLKRQMFSIGEDFWIENDQGQPIYKVDGKALRIRETFVLEDRNGAELATIQAKLLAFMPTMTIQRSGQPWVTVKKIPFTFFHQEFEIDVQDGRTLTTDGPFVAVKEALGGYFLFEADDLDAAIELASRIPAARLGGGIEIRPIKQG